LGRLQERAARVDLDQSFRPALSPIRMMPEEKPHQPKKETKPPRLAEMQLNLEDYALRKIIEKLRRKLDRAE
jgi:hypothetical protein